MKGLFTILMCLLSLHFCKGQSTSSLDSANNTTAMTYIRSWLQPSAVTTQFAGNVGYFSGGPVWNIYKNKLELSGLVGFIPTEYSRTDHVIFTLKLNYRFKTAISLDENTVIKPFNPGILSTRFFGEHFTRYRDEEKYADYYYRWGPYLRLGFSNEIHISRKLNHKWFEKVSFYLDTSFWDLDINSYVAHKNYKSKVMDFEDLITLGLGFTTYFK